MESIAVTNRDNYWWGRFIGGVKALVNDLFEIRDKKPLLLRNYLIGSPNRLFFLYLIPRRNYLLLKDKSIKPVKLPGFP